MRTIATLISFSLTLAIAASAFAQDAGVPAGPDLPVGTGPVVTAPTAAPPATNVCLTQMQDALTRATAASRCINTAEYEAIVTACRDYMTDFQHNLEEWIAGHCRSARSAPVLVPSPTPTPTPHRDPGGGGHRRTDPVREARCREDLGATRVGSHCVCLDRTVTFADGSSQSYPRALVHVAGTRDDYACAMTEDGVGVISEHIFEERIRAYREELDRMHSTDADLQRQIDELRRRLDAIRPGASYDDTWIHTEIARINNIDADQNCRLDRLERRELSADCRSRGYSPLPEASATGSVAGPQLVYIEPSVAGVFAARVGGPLSGAGVLSIGVRFRMHQQLFGYVRGDFGLGGFGNGTGTVMYAGGAGGLLGELYAAPNGDFAFALFGGFTTHWWGQPGDDSHRDLQGGYRGLDIGGELGLRLTFARHFFIEFGASLTGSDAVWVARDAQDTLQQYGNTGFGAAPFLRIGGTF